MTPPIWRDSGCGFPPLLSVVAGMVDVIGYLSLKLFTVLVTGNLVVIAALLVHGGPANLAPILAVPIFLAGQQHLYVRATALWQAGGNLGAYL